MAGSIGKGNPLERIAFISDIHACPEALEAVLAHIRSEEATRIVCLGDLVGYGPSPRRALALARKACGAFVLGNHDAMLVAEGLDFTDLNPAIGHPLGWAKRTLSPATREWITHLPLEIAEDGWQASHSGLAEPGTFPHMENDKTAMISRHFAAQKAPVSFFGHTHIPSALFASPDGQLRILKPQGTLHLDRPGKYAVGTGSISFSRDGNPLPSWVMFYPAEAKVVFHRTPCDPSPWESLSRQRIEATLAAGGGTRTRTPLAG